MATQPEIPVTQPHFVTIPHGRFGITILSDGSLTLGGDIFAPEANAEERLKILSRLDGDAETALAQSNIPLIIAGQDKILVDVGAGALLQPTEGRLERNLNAMGIDADDITMVVLSHAHPDHLWGMLRPDGSLRFAHARYFISKAEWDFWMGRLAESLPDVLRPMVDGARRDLLAIADRVTFVDEGDEIVPGLRVLSTPGHTAGHISLVLDGDESDERPLLITVDAAASEVVSTEYPHWSFGFDMQPEVARVTRRQMLDRAAAEGAVMVGFHWTYPGIGRVEKNGDAYRFLPGTGKED